MADQDVIDRVFDKYGATGLIIISLSMSVVIGLWVAAVIFLVWPVVIPIVAALWMVWNTREKNDD